MDALLAAPIGALLIFLLRIVDVSMSIMRMILAVRGHRVAAASIGFFEVLIWLVAVGAALEHPGQAHVMHFPHVMHTPQAPPQLHSNLSSLRLWRSGILLFPNKIKLAHRGFAGT